MIEKTIFSILLILTGLTLGYMIRIFSEKGKIRIVADLSEISKGIQKGVMLFLLPVTVTGALWIVSFNDGRLFFFPFLGAFHYFTGGLLALGASYILNEGRKQTGSLFCSGFFTNIGSIGGLVTFILVGEEGYALVPFYKIFAEVIYYSVGFPVASLFGQRSEKRESFLSILARLSKDTFIRVALSAVALGLFLNFAGISRPGCYGTVNAFLIPLVSFLLLVAIGMGIKFSRMRYYVKECITIIIIRSVLLPVILVTIALLAGFGNMASGLPLKVVAVLSFMPAAFVTLLPASIYDLDLDLANACWLVSTLSVIIFIPVIYQVIKLVS